MANIKLTNDYWEASGVYDITYGTGKTQRSINSELKGAINNLEKPIMLVFGDSWSEPNGQYSWVTEFENSHPMLNIKNYAKAGAKLAGGDISGENGTIGGQIVTAIADTSYLKADVKYIILMGGTNDYRRLTTLSEAGAQPIAVETKNNIDRLKSNYPNAIINVMINHSIGVASEQMRFCNYMANYLARNSGVSAYNMIGWISPNYFASDYIHLLAAGLRQVQTNIEKIIYGGDLNYITCIYTGGVLNFPDGETGYSGIFTITEMFSKHGVTLTINARIAQAIAATIRTTGTVSRSQLASSLLYEPFVYVPLTKTQLSKAQAPCTAFFTGNYTPIADHNNLAIDYLVTIVFDTDALANRTALGQWTINETW